MPQWMVACTRGRTGIVNWTQWVILKSTEDLKMGGECGGSPEEVEEGKQKVGQGWVCPNICYSCMKLLKKKNFKEKMSPLGVFTHSTIRILFSPG